MAATGFPPAVLAFYVRQNCARGLPEVTEHPPRPEPLTLVASGPSAINAPLTGHTLAVNGSIRLFTERGLAPTWWAALDPREAITALLPDDPPRDTTYLVCDRCSPSVFSKLKGRDVRIWHISGDEAEGSRPEGLHSVLTASTVTAAIIPLMEMLGYRRIDAYGWDGCYMDGRDHVRPQAHSRANDVTVAIPDVGDFRTTDQWVLEADDIDRLLNEEPRLAEVTIHGAGFFAAYMRHVRAMERAA